jgi:hypothetical protein
MEAERAEIVNIREEKKAREERAFKQFEEMVREGQKIKEARREQERAENGGELKERTLVSTDAKSFGVDGAKIDEKKSEELGKYMHIVDRDKETSGTNPFSGEKIVDVKESDLVREAREERWGPGSEQVRAFLPWTLPRLPPQLC